MRMRREPSWLKYKVLVDKAIVEENYIDGTWAVVDPLPRPDDVRAILEQHFKAHSDRSFRVILVEDYADCKVFIQIPGGKSEYDFYV
ncbi:MAG: hypothetical protein QXL27_04580 [Candidatus Bathyarchaeia archaeon]